jgi:NRPS condensation-like uncharacterized protein
LDITNVDTRLDHKKDIDSKYLEELELSKNLSPIGTIIFKIFLIIGVAPKEFKQWKHRDKVTKIIVSGDYVWSCSLDKNICCWDKHVNQFDIFLNVA